MKPQLLASAPTHEELAKCVNRFWYSDVYAIVDGNLSRSDGGKVPDGFRVVVKGKRWRFEFVG